MVSRKPSLRSLAPDTLLRSLMPLMELTSSRLSISTAGSSGSSSSDPRGAEAGAGAATAGLAVVVGSGLCIFAGGACAATALEEGRLSPVRFWPACPPVFATGAAGAAGVGALTGDGFGGAVTGTGTKAGFVGAGAFGAEAVGVGVD